MSSQRGFFSDADQAQPFDEHTPWMFLPGDPGTRELVGNPGDGEIQKTPRATNSAVSDPVIQFSPLSQRAVSARGSHRYAGQKTSSYVSTCFVREHNIKKGSGAYWTRYGRQLKE